MRALARAALPGYFVKDNKTIISAPERTRNSSTEIAV